MKKEPQKSVTIWAATLLFILALLSMAVKGQIDLSDLEALFAAIGLGGLRRALP